MYLSILNLWSSKLEYNLIIRLNLTRLNNKKNYKLLIKHNALLKLYQEKLNRYLDKKRYWSWILPLEPNTCSEETEDTRIVSISRAIIESTGNRSIFDFHHCKISNFVVWPAATKNLTSNWVCMYVFSSMWFTGYCKVPEEEEDVAAFFLFFIFFMDCHPTSLRIQSWICWQVCTLFPCFCS